MMMTTAIIHCCLLCVRHSVDCFVNLVVFTPQTTLQDRHGRSCSTELETNSDMRFASSHPAVETEDYQILKVHGLLAASQGVCADLLLSLEWI